MAKKTGIFYGTSTGHCARIAEEIGQCLGVDKTDIYDVSETAPSKVGEYEILIFGSSTWGDGEIQEDMEDFLSGVSCMSLTDKKIGLFGCGDETNEETFCDAVGKMREKLTSTGATFIGEFNDGGYDFKSSTAVKDGVAVGLLLDEVNRADLTPKRVAEWCKKILKEE